MASVDKRSPHVVNATILQNNGPFLARVVNNVDPMKMGSLEVELLRPVGNQADAAQQLFTVRYLSPFYGVTGIEQCGTNNYDFNDTQKSYGFWAVPPDVGVVVLVIFVEADPSQGFWIGCVPDTYMNHMIPGIAGSTAIEDQYLRSDDQAWMEAKKTQDEFPTNFLPVGEVNRMTFKKGGDNAPTPNANVEANKKPIHPIAEHLLIQGLITDPIKGVHTSSARRESPSNVYGWSTPGPVDKRKGAKKGQIGYKNGKINKFVSRLGGHCIIMDDGNEKRLRTSRPWEGPSEYVDIEEDNSGKGLPYYPEDDAFRIRTRTGHQILLHNSEDLIFICNSRGTAWIEMTSNGKIEFFAKDSISFRSEADFNFHGERDVNIHSGRSFNSYSQSSTTINACNDISMGSVTNVFVNAGTDIGMQSPNKIAITGDQGVDLKTNKMGMSASNFELQLGGNFFIDAANVELKGNNVILTADSEFHLTSGSNAYMNMLSLDANVGIDLRFEAGQDFSMRAGNSFAVSAITGSANLFGKSEMNIETLGQTNMRSEGQLRAKGSQIHLNSEEPNRAATAIEAAAKTACVEAQGTTGGTDGGQVSTGQGLSSPDQLCLYPNPGVGLSICKRTPSCLPYDSEHLNPQGQTPAYTDNRSEYVPIRRSGGTRYTVRSTSDNDSIPGRAGGMGNGSYTWGSLRAGRQGPEVYDTSNTNRGAPYGGEIPATTENWTKDTEFLNATEKLARKYGLQKEDLLAVFAIETGKSMAPHANNNIGGGHAGLIQFGQGACKIVGTSLGALMRMSRVQQMPYIEKYFDYWAGKMGRPQNCGDLYMLVAQPANVRKGLDDVIFARGTDSWSNNAQWRDPQPNGPVTRRGIMNGVMKWRRWVERMLGKSANTQGSQTPAAPGSQSGISPANTARDAATSTPSTGNRQGGTPYVYPEAPPAGYNWSSYPIGGQYVLQNTRSGAFAYQEGNVPTKQGGTNPK